MTAVLDKPAATPAEAPARRRRFKRPSVGAVIVYVAVVLLAVLWLLPLLWALSTSLKTETEASLGQDVHWIPRDWSLDGYRAVFEQGDHLVWMVNSTVVSTIVTVLTLTLCVLAAYGFSRFDFPGKNVVFGVIIAGLMVPGEALIIPLFDIVGFLNLSNTYWGLALPQVVAPVMVFILKRFFDAVPRDYEEAAKIDGAGHLRVLWSVILPLSGPILAAVGIFTFIGSWNNFLWPLLVATDPSMMTLPVGLGVVTGGTACCTRRTWPPRSWARCRCSSCS
ncbi:carbohydrate ABC transporter membrane protein 2 (CUT1 family) [Glycomyces artemisiae]|uniref:Carbohydrate ABC transporter membrane protein 2 (CUT1 family) n=1 Tax=Glycomyces artemisiae TaxID=1076443 RepID=A0A2T0UVA8_9ACTN|nr:carbohydrate ABC transporter permease [Glycomyces artemisiae]PRY61865.1 carbohydrate ABC transporter membrane protein 2 (CUT1 family) [Glycomyces artemisiae]